MNKKIRDTPELKVPKGYEFEEIYDTDDTGYGYDDPVLEEEVMVDFGTSRKEYSV